LGPIFKNNFAQDVKMQELKHSLGQAAYERLNAIFSRPGAHPTILVTNIRLQIFVDCTLNIFVALIQHSLVMTSFLAIILNQFFEKYL
jgi:hypothetical protein